MSKTIVWMARGVLAVCIAAVAGPPLAQDMQCPQPRFTGKAPADYLSRTNPLPDNEGNRSAGQRVFAAGGASCATCHGESGAGNGPLARQFEPPPRNFACAQTVNGIPDGQLFWIVRYGSPGTAMPDHPGLSDEQIWQVVHYLRHLAR